MFWIYPYKQASKGAKMLAEELDCKRILLENSSYKYKEDHLIINWGSGDCPFPQALNPGKAIMSLIDKKKFFQRLVTLGLTPPFATSIEAAKTLGYPVFCRTSLQGYDGKGIVVADCEGQLVPAPLYTKGIDKTSEYRVHIGRYPNGQVYILGGSQKCKKQISPEMKNVPSDSRIWCGDTTYFDDFTKFFPTLVTEVVAKAFAEFPDLTFAAFDVVYDNSVPEAYVIEGNSAPMMTPQTTKAYAGFFKEYAIQAKMLHPSVTEVVPPMPSLNVVVEDLVKGKINFEQVLTGYLKSIGS